MSNAVLTDDARECAKLLYKDQKMRPPQIAKALNLPEAAVYAWIRLQPWYETGEKKGRLAKQIEKMDLSMSDDDFSHHERNDTPYNIVFPFQVPSLNEYIAAINQNKNSGNRFKAAVEKRMIPFIRKAMPRGFRPFDCKVQVHITFYESSDKRDWDNVISSEKFIFDALQAAAVIGRDDQKHLLPPTHSFERDKNPHSVVSIYCHPDLPVEKKKDYTAKAIVRPKHTWRDVFSEDEIRSVYRQTKDKDAQYKIFLDFGITKAELDRVLGTR